MSVPPLEAAARTLELDVEALEARVDAVLQGPLTWFPVRHHSPAAARHVRALIEQRRPKLVLIEGPWQANHVIPHLVDRATRPPVAVYCSYRDDDDVLGLAGVASPAPDVPARFSCWYPLLDYSPELVAIRAAAKLGAEVAFIDLPFQAGIRPRVEEGEDGDDHDHDHEREGERDLRPNWEKALVESDLYQRLTALAGYRSWDETWDSLFELGAAAEDVETFRRKLALFCAASRATIPPHRLEADGTLPRERFMIRRIRAELAERGVAAEDALVVCGGFHLFLDPDDPLEPPPIPPGTVHCTVTPYSYFRLWELSGYAAGNRAPRFYQTCWERRDAPDEALIEHAVAVLKQARRKGESLSAADAIAVTQHMRLLANLRARSGPVLDDLHDALVTCCVKGVPEEEGAHVLAAMEKVAVGTRVGRVTDAIGRLPIVADFYHQLDRLELSQAVEDEGRLELVLDTREAPDHDRSILLRRLEWLGVGLARREETLGIKGALFRERWALAWTPKVEPSLIELNLYGDTVEAATLAKLEEELARGRHEAGATCARLRDAVDLDLPHLLARVEQVCSAALDQDGRLTSLGPALVHLQVVARVAEHRRLGALQARLPELLERCFGRACFSVRDAASAPDDEHPAITEALRALAEAVVGDRAGRFDRNLLVEHLHLAADESSVPRLRGLFLGTLAEIKAIAPEALAAEVASYALLPQDRLVAAGDLLAGMLTASRTSILLGGDALVGAVDQLLAAAEWESFLTMLPSLRVAFEQLHPSQRDGLAHSVARRHGLKDGDALSAPLETSVQAAAAIARADARVGAILARWGL